MLLNRTDSIFRVAADLDLNPGASYRVTVHRPGGIIVSAIQTSTNVWSITFAPGHGFRVDDRIQLALDTTSFGLVTAVSGNVVTASTSASLASGDTIINLGTDSGTGVPTGDGSNLVLYSTPDETATPIQLATIDVNSEGMYGYYHSGDQNLWELFFNSAGEPVAFKVDAYQTASRELNVKDFGAIGDGVADDYSAIQAALTAVPSTGAAVVIPAGVYMVSSALWIKSNTHLRGDGIDVSTIKRADDTLSSDTDDYLVNHGLTCGSAVGTVFTDSNPGASITITDLTYDGNATAQTITATNGAFLFGSGQTLGSDSGGCVDGLTIQRCKFVNGLQDGIRPYNSRNILIDSNIITQVGLIEAVGSKNGINLTGGPTDLALGWDTNAIITNNRVSYVGDAVTRAAGNPSSEGIAIITWDNVTIAHNDISFVDYGIEGTYTTSGSYINHNWNICNNAVHDLTSTTVAGQIGITVARSASQGLRGLTVSNNTIYNINHTGININVVNGVTVSGNVLHSVCLDADATYFNAIDMYTCTDVACTGNSVYLLSAAAATQGIRFLTVTRGVMTGNVVYNDSGSATSANFNLNSGTQSCLVTGNRSVGGNWGFRIGSSGTNSGNIICINQASGTITASYSDISGQTNYLDCVLADTVAATTLLTSATVTSTGVMNVGTFLRLGAASAITIATGVATATKSHHTVTGEGGAADDLVTITAATDGQILLLRPTSDSVTITVKHGTGNIFLTGAADFALDSDKDRLLLVADGTNWLEIGRGANA